MGLTELIEWAMEHLSYEVVFVLMVLENSVVPLPAELIVTPAAYKAAMGEMDITLLIIFTTLGSTIGAIINYYLSLFLGRPLIYKFADSKLGHLLLLSQKKMERAEELFRKNGNWSTFVGRLLPAGRQLISIPAGLARMNIAAFIFYTTIGSAIWNSVLSLAGYLLADMFPPEEINETLEHYGTMANVVIFAIIGVVAVFYITKKIIKKRRKKSDTTSDSL